MRRLTFQTLRRLEPPTPIKEMGRDAFHRIPELSEVGDAVERVPTAPHSGALWRATFMGTHFGCYIFSDRHWGRITICLFSLTTQAGG